MIRVILLHYHIRLPCQPFHQSDYICEFCKVNSGLMKLVPGLENKGNVWIYKSRWNFVSTCAGPAFVEISPPQIPEVAGCAFAAWVIPWRPATRLFVPRNEFSHCAIRCTAIRNRIFARWISFTGEKLHACLRNVYLRQ